MKKNTQLILIGVAIILVVALSIKLSRFSADDQANDNNKIESSETPTTPVLDNTNATTETPTQPKTTTAPKVAKPTPALSYSDAITKYTGYRFQFSNNCSASTPNSFVIKSGYKFMVDNRENMVHIFTFDKQKAIVKPYSYAIFTAQTTGAQSVYCDGVQRVLVNVAK